MLLLLKVLIPLVYFELNFILVFVSRRLLDRILILAMHRGIAIRTRLVIAHYEGMVLIHILHIRLLCHFGSVIRWVARLSHRLRLHRTLSRIFEVAEGLSEITGLHELVCALR